MQEKNIEQINIQSSNSNKVNIEKGFIQKENNNNKICYKDKSFIEKFKYQNYSLFFNNFNFYNKDEDK